MNGNFALFSLPVYAVSMSRSLLAPPLPSSFDIGSERYEQNRSDTLEQLEVIDGLLAEAKAGGGPEAMDRLRSRG